MMKIRDVAAITTPDMRTIQIQAWDKSSIQPIEKGIISSNPWDLPRYEWNIDKTSNS
jgi:ribosome recycling factor